MSGLADSGTLLSASLSDEHEDEDMEKKGEEETVQAIKVLFEALRRRTRARRTSHENFA